MDLLKYLLILYPLCLIALFAFKPRWALFFFFATKFTMDLFWQDVIFEGFNTLKITGTLFPCLCIFYYVKYRPQIMSNPMSLFFGIILGMNLVSTAWGFANGHFAFFDIPHTPLSLRHALDWNVRFLNIAGAALIVPFILHQENDSKKLMMVFLISALLPCIVSLYQISTVSIQLMLATLSEPYSVTLFQRLHATYHDPGTLSVVMFTAIVSSSFLFFQQRSQALKFVCIIVFMIATFILYFTFSRTWWISATMFLFVFFYFQKKFTLLATTALFVVIMITAVPLTQKRFEREWSFIVNPMQNSNTSAIEKMGTGRIWLWNDAFKHFSNLDPVSQAIGSGRAFGSHNQYIAWILKNGILGLTVWCFFLYRICVMLYRRFLLVHPSEVSMRHLSFSVFFTIAMLTNMFMQSFDNVTLGYFVWSLVGLAITSVTHKKRTGSGIAEI